MKDNPERTGIYSSQPREGAQLRGGRTVAFRYSFGSFSLKSHGDTLYRGEELVRLGSRACQILAVLVARAGQVVSKADLMAEVWPDTTVVENNLNVHIAALRRTLGNGRDDVQYIVNVPGRGYRFVAPVREEFEGGDAPSFLVQAAFSTNLPVRLTPAIGLSKSIEEVAARMRGNNLVTVTGPAGVGKTTLALHVAKAELSLHADGVWLVDLAPLTEAGHVFAAVAATMHIDLGAGDSMDTLLAALAHGKALLLLDNCEHLIDAVANLAAKILRHCPQVVLLATSREPLRVSGETTYVLAPLDTPPDTATIGAEEALTYPAVKLLVERITAATNDFAFSDDDAVAATSVCRRLDGLPLAIEFAAALVGAFGLAGLAARLDDLFKLMQNDIRGASLRHRTLTAALDWSYSLLDRVEQTALRRLAWFPGGFTLEGAATVIGIANLDEVGGLLARLHAKSLITSDIIQRNLRFRLLATTRAYALAKLEPTEGTNEIHNRSTLHAGDSVNVAGEIGR